MLIDNWQRSLALPGVLALAVLAAGCAGDGAEELPYVERPVEELYNDGLRSMRFANWEEAAARFDEVERQHPYSVWARRAILMSAYAHYQANNYAEAVEACNRFIQLHPGNEDVVYAYYLKAVSLYEQITDVARDQGRTREALAALEDVARRFPDTTYGRDARLKIDLAVDHLAGKEMAIGRWYLRQGHYIAAINRFRSVVENYQTTSHVPEALHRLTEAYLTLGIVSEAQTSAAVLGHNFPGSDWYQDSYTLLTQADVAPQENEDSWISRTFRSVF